MKDVCQPHYRISGKVPSYDRSVFLLIDELQPERGDGPRGRSLLYWAKHSAKKPVRLDKEPRKDARYTYICIIYGGGRSVLFTI